LVAGRITTIALDENPVKILPVGQTSSNLTFPPRRNGLRCIVMA
jgi:hypothetical protein